MGARSISIALAVILLAVVEGCGPNLSPTAIATPPALPVTVLVNQGYVAGPLLVAAPSLTDLLAMVHGIGVRPGLDECQRFQDLRPSCWLDVKDPGDSLLIAALINEPCMLTNSVSAALSSTNEISVTVINSGSCPGGIPPGPSLSLLAIPLSVLPTDEITLDLVHPGIPAHSTRMMVDLRRPLDVHTDVQARIHDVDTAINAAQQDALKRITPGQTVTFLGIGTNRWADTSLGCPIQGRAYPPADARGLVVFMRGSDQPQLAMEYHWSGSTLTFCGRVPY